MDQAVKTYEKVVADNPAYAPAMHQLALLYGQLSTDSAKAYELVTKAHQAFPDDAVIAKTLGILTYRRAFYPQSLELLKEAAAKRKDDAEVLYYLGEVHRQLKQYPECKSELERALTLNLSPGLANDAKGAATCFCAYAYGCPKNSTHCYRRSGWIIQTRGFLKSPRLTES